MVEQAVLEFLDALSPDLRQAALFPFASEERRNWHYIPRQRRGVPLKQMTEAQRRAPPRHCCTQPSARAAIRALKT